MARPRRSKRDEVAVTPRLRGPVSLGGCSSPSRAPEAVAPRGAGGLRCWGARAVGELRPRRAPRVLTAPRHRRSLRRGQPGAHPRPSWSFGRRRSPGPSAGLLGAVSFVPSLGTGPGPPGLGRWEHQVGFPGWEWREEIEPRRGARGKRPPLWGARPARGCGDHLLGAVFPDLQQLQGAPCKSAPRTQKESGHPGGRRWAGAGTLGGTCRSVRGCPHRTRGRSAHTGAHSCLPAQQAGRDARLANPVPIQAFR